MEMNQLIGCQKNRTLVLVFGTPHLKTSVFSHFTDNRTNVCILKTGLYEQNIIEHLFDKNFFEIIEKVVDT